MTVSGLVEHQTFGGWASRGLFTRVLGQLTWMFCSVIDPVTLLRVKDRRVPLSTAVSFLNCYFYLNKAPIYVMFLLNSSVISLCASTYSVHVRKWFGSTGESTAWCRVFVDEEGQLSLPDRASHTVYWLFRGICIVEPSSLAQPTVVDCSFWRKLHYLDLLWICRTTYRRYNNGCRQGEMRKVYHRTILLQFLQQVYRVAQNKIPHWRICNISANGGLILKILEAN